jgi:serine/threonine protein phosphatase PrpC
MAARCEAAGRHNNEDNFQLTDNLSGNQWGFITGQEVEPGEKGVLMVVCDGMGGMNAGAEASKLAVNSIKECFAAERLTPQVMASSATIIKHIEQAIVTADRIIKENGQQNRERKGMGSTIVLGWIVRQEIYVGWCGDSRAYRFNPAFGLERLSHDHSYVQEMVDSGKLSKELAFDHPDTNIITRSLGDVRQQAQPDVQCCTLYNNDIILLCSDGLHGVLRDTEIEQILAKNTDAIENCRNMLWTESEKAGWTDNVTIALCRVVSGARQVETPISEPAPTYTLKEGAETISVNGETVNANGEPVNAKAKTSNEKAETTNGNGESTNGESTNRESTNRESTNRESTNMDGETTNGVSKKRKHTGLKIAIIVLLLLGIAFGAGYYLNTQNQWFDKVIQKYTSYVTSTGHTI